VAAPFPASRPQPFLLIDTPQFLPFIALILFSTPPSGLSLGHLWLISVGEGASVFDHCPRFFPCETCGRHGRSLDVEVLVSVPGCSWFFADCYMGLKLLQAVFDQCFSPQL